MPVRTSDIPDLDTAYARDLYFPLTFTDDCDLLMDEDVAVIDQSLQFITFIRQGTIRLFPEMGSYADRAVFDQLDEETELLIDSSLRSAFEALEPRVVLDKEFAFDETADEERIVVLVPYTIKVNGKLASSRFVIPRNLSG